MNGNPRNTLSEQAASLQRTIMGREKRRAAARDDRPADPYDGRQAGGGGGGKRQRPEDGTAPPSAAAALAAIAAAGHDAPPPARCELCAVNLASEAELAQHVAGPVHRKALDRAAAQRLRDEQLARYGNMAESALASAAAMSAYGEGRGGGAGGGGGNGGGGRAPAAPPGPPAARWKPPPGRDAPPPPPAASQLSHDALMAKARARDEVLNINGAWPRSRRLRQPKTNTRRSEGWGITAGGCVCGCSRRARRRRRLCARAHARAADAPSPPTPPPLLHRLGPALAALHQLHRGGRGGRSSRGAARCRSSRAGARARAPRQGQLAPRAGRGAAGPGLWQRQRGQRGQRRAGGEQWRQQLGRRCAAARLLLLEI